MPPNIINDEQYEFWNKGIGQKWVKEDNSLNERFNILTKALVIFFARSSKLPEHPTQNRTSGFLPSAFIDANV